jgi:hypothetical protein
LKYFVSLICFFLVFQTVKGQFSISGKVLDQKTGRPLPGAGIGIFKKSRENPNDSSLVKGTQSDSTGDFKVSDLSRGFYVVKIQFLGYLPQVKRAFLRDGDTDLATIQLLESATKLQEVQVEGKTPPVRQLGDTTQFNASSFKTNTDATAEDLVTKMPGIQIQNGQVNAQGEQVRKVLVDNKPFFGDDPNTALKNLPAEIIDKIQVFDQMSDQSRFTGFNDGNTQKTINIITKAGMRNGNFGRAYAGYGTNERYKGGLTYNRFAGPQRLTLIAQANNINEQNFSMADLAGVMGSGGGSRGGAGLGGGGMGRMIAGGMGAGMGRGGPFNSQIQDFLVGNKRGIVNTQAVGLNFSDNLGKKVELTGNYFFNRSVNDVLQNTVRNYVVSRDSGQNYQETNLSRTENLNHRFNLRAEWKIDTNNSILYTPRFTLQNVKTSSEVNGDNRLREIPLNATLNAYAQTQQLFSINNEFLFRHRFKKKGRTISINTNLGNTGTIGDLSQNSENSFFGKTKTVDTLQQWGEIDKKGWSIQNNLTYTEPVGKKGQLSVNYGLNYAKNSSSRLIFPGAEQERNPEDPNLSNQFKSEVPQQYGGLGYGLNTDKSMLNVSVNYQYASLINDRTYPSPNKLRRDFQNVLPMFIWRYSITEKKNFRLIYRTSANAPSVDQLQDVVNNSNPIQLLAGNKNLRQDFQHNLFFRYSSTNEKDNSSFFGLIAASATRHYIGNNTLIANRDTLVDDILLNRGTQLIRPVNLAGYFSLRSFLMYSKPLNALKTNLNLNANANVTRTPGLVNGKNNFALSPTLGAGLGLTSNISKAVDFNLGYNISYTSVENTLQTGQNDSYVNHILSGRLNFVFWESLVFNTDYSQNIFNGLNQGFNTNFTLLNMGLGYKFLKNKQAELRLTAFDLLEQNTNISRSITETYLEDVRANNLQRYFMLTFTYTLRAFKMPESKDGPPPMHPGMIRPGVGPPGMIVPPQGP